MTRLPIFPALLVAFSLVAQTAPKVDASHLTLQEAIETSLRNNLQVQISAETRNVSHAGVTINEGTFDWQLTSALNLSYSKLVFADRQISPLYPSQSGDQVTDYHNLTVGLSKPTQWGGTFQLNYNPTYTYTEYNYTNTTTSTPTPYSGYLSASFTQSLLRNFGRDTAASNRLIERGREGLYRAAKQFPKRRHVRHFRLFALPFIEAAMDRPPSFWQRFFAKR